MLKINHSAGFFSCCSVKLYNIIRHFNKYKKLPEIINYENEFDMYNPFNKSITNDFFETNNMNILYTEFVDFYLLYQFNYYNRIKYNQLNIFIEKYFTLSQEIIDIKNSLLEKYKIDQHNCIALYYRGTDKIVETKLGPFLEYYQYVEHIIKKNPNIILLVQTDSQLFIDFIKSKYTNIIIISELQSSYNNIGTHFQNNKLENYNQIKYLLATIHIISECKYIVTSSGNCSLWALLYRGNSNNVYQYLENKFIQSIT